MMVRTFSRVSASCVFFSEKKEAAVSFRFVNLAGYARPSADGFFQVFPRANGVRRRTREGAPIEGGAYRGGEDTEVRLGDDHGARLEGGGGASAELHLFDRTRGRERRLSLDGDLTVISATGRRPGSAPRAGRERWIRTDSGALDAIRAQRAESRRARIRRTRATAGRGARARALVHSLRTRVACDFALRKSDAGARERDAATGATALVSPWGP